MILNERQYKVTKAQIVRLENALAASRGLRVKMPSRAYKAMSAGIRSQIQELREQLKEYERMTKATTLRLDSVESLPEVLIRGRVARGYTQKDLAEKLHIKPQQIQRYEATGYRTASLKRIVEIMNALELDLQARIPLEPRSRVA